MSDRKITLEEARKTALLVYEDAERAYDEYGETVGSEVYDCADYDLLEKLEQALENDDSLERIQAIIQDALKCYTKLDSEEMKNEQNKKSKTRRDRS